MENVNQELVTNTPPPVTPDVSSSYTLVHVENEPPSIIGFFRSKKFARLRSITIGALLTLQGLSNLYESIKFVVIEYPELSERLAEHHLGSEELTRLIMRAIVLLTTAIVGLFIASRLTHGGEEVEESAETVMGIVVLFAAAGIRKMVEEGTVVGIIGELAFQVLHWLEAIAQSQ